MERWEGRVAVVVDFAGSPTGVAICRDLVEHGLIVIGLTKRDGMRGLEASFPHSRAHYLTMLKTRVLGFESVISRNEGRALSDGVQRERRGSHQSRFQMDRRNLSRYRFAY